MHTEMAKFAHDSSGIWKNQQIALGSLTLYSTPESVGEIQPLKSGSLTLIHDGRLDNRHTLLNQLSIPASEQVNTTDGMLIFKSFQKWGKHCVEHLLGDWSFAVWDDAKKMLTVARDHFGVTSLFYYADQNTFAFASSIQAIIALPEVPRILNEKKLAQILAVFSGRDAMTMYEGVLMLSPANILQISQRGFNINRYWQLEQNEVQSGRKRESYAEELQQVFKEAVKCRLRSHRKVGATLSGGLDSSAVAAIAAKNFQEKELRLPVFSSVPLFRSDKTTLPNRFADETPYIDATAHYLGNIDVNYIRSENTTPLQGLFKTFNITSHAACSTSNDYWLHDLYETAQKRGVGTLLTGTFGNLTISRDGRMQQPLRHHLWRFELRKAQTEIKMDLKKHKSIINMIRFGRNMRTGFKPWLAYSAISDEFTHRIGLRDYMASVGHDPTYSDYGSISRADILKWIDPELSSMGTFLNLHARGYGLQIRDPTLDKRILELTLSIPEWVFRSENNETRWLIRKAMEGYMPEKVLHNKKRGQQAADLNQRLLNDLESINKLIDLLEKSSFASQYLSIVKLRNVVNNIKYNSDPGSWRISWRVLMPGLMVGIFLLQWDSAGGSLDKLFELSDGA